MPFRDIIAIYSENHTEHINKSSGEKWGVITLKEFVGIHMGAV
jgi:hypothetical protein